MKICDYGCGKEATHFFKNGKKCCEKIPSKCEALINKNKKQVPWNKGKNGVYTDEALKKMRDSHKGQTLSEKSRQKLSKSLKGKPKSEEHKKNISKGRKGIVFTEEHKKNISKAGKGQIPWNKGKTGIYSEESLKKMSDGNKGKNHPMYGKKLLRKTKDRISSNMIGKTKYTIEYILNRYPTFSKIEEMRYNPNTSDEIQVHCKNHNCKNSKENTGWFTPDIESLKRRIYSIERLDGNGGGYLYCCDNCKDDCPLYNLRSDPNKTIDKPYTQEEYQIFRQEVFNRNGYYCEYCDQKGNHVHHSRPQKLEPGFVLDPDFGVVCCSECHYKYGHKDECSTGQLANVICAN